MSSTREAIVPNCSPKSAMGFDWLFVVVSSPRISDKSFSIAAKWRKNKMSPKTKIAAIK